MKIIEFHVIIINKNENHIISCDNHSNHKYHRTPYANLENKETLRILFENHENYENLRIPIDNNENTENINSV